ncbi:YncE family protein [Kitasatospora sp. NPDC001309]|uniref:YncE family protein n=1 Tax=Kitasatospora sp. NPDC001309 TaxID=3364013 RepID=UPI00369A78F7
MPNTPLDARAHLDARAQLDARAHLAGDVLAVVSQSGPTVSFFDAATDALLDTVEVPAQPHELCFDPTQRLLWCTSAYRSGYYNAHDGHSTELTVIDADTRTVVEVIDLAPEHGPHGLALDPVRGRLYVSVEASTDRPGGVVVVDTATRRPLGRIDTDAPGPHWFAISPDGRTGYATNKEAPYVSVVDLDRGTLTAKITVPGSEGLAVSADGARVYVGGPYLGFAGKPDAAPGIRVLDTRTASVVDVLPTGSAVLPVHLTSGGRLLAGEIHATTSPDSPLGRQDPGCLTVFSAATHRRLGSVEVGRFPLTITSSPDGRFGYVASVVSSTVDVVDLDTLTPVTRLTVPKLAEPGAHGLAYLPRPA